MTVVAGGPFESGVAFSGSGGVGRGGAAEPVGPQGGDVFDREEVVARDPDAAFVGHDGIVRAMQTEEGHRLDWFGGKQVVGEAAGRGSNGAKPVGMGDELVDQASAVGVAEGVDPG